MSKLIVTVGIVFVLAMASFGQQQGGKSGQPSGTKAENVSLLDVGTRLEGQLQSTLDVKKANVGDEVVLKTTKNIKENGRTIVPKGSKLIGRITEVQQGAKGNSTSQLGVIFDRLQTKDFTSEISATIVSITNLTSGARLGDTADADLFGSSSTSASASGSSRAGGGLLGGTGGLLNGTSSTLGSVTNTVGSTVNTGVQTVGNVAASTGQTVSSGTGSVFRTVNGIQVSNSASGSAQASSTLSAPGKNLRIEKGAAIQLQLSSEAKAQ
jgi:hypothetical protein